MAMLVRDPLPPELARFLERRRELGQDGFDEVWQGVYHVAPAPNSWHGYAVLRVAELLSRPAQETGLTATDQFNLGETGNYRVPDLGYHREFPTATFVATAAIVVEVVSPDDETYAKLGFYAERGVDEVLVVDPAGGRARWFIRTGSTFDERPASVLLRVDAAVIARGLRWPGA